MKLVFVSVNWKHFDTISANYLSMVWHNISVPTFYSQSYGGRHKGEGGRGSVFSRLGSAAGGSSGSVFSRLSGIGGERRGSSWHKVTVSVQNCSGGELEMVRQWVAEGN